MLYRATLIGCKSSKYLKSAKVARAEIKRENYFSWSLSAGGEVDQAPEEQLLVPLPICHPQKNIGFNVFQESGLVR
jgi:hypothetical protein